VTKLSSLSVFFPCFNESENLPLLLEQALKTLSTFADKVEVIVVDDGSTDTTKQIVQSYMSQDNRIRLVQHERNLGYGASLRSGIKAARYEWTFWTDGDLQFQLSSLKTFIAHASPQTAVIGYRKHRADTFIRKVNGELYTQLINVLFGLRVRDIDCAFKLIPTKQLQQLSIRASGAFTSAEILIRLHKKGIRFVQLPVQHFPRKYGKPTGGSLRVIFRGMRETLAFYLYRQYET
jgi:glycosyltransferase involved in cell wall biosynthesis